MEVPPIRAQHLLVLVALVVELVVSATCKSNPLGGAALGPKPQPPSTDLRVIGAHFFFAPRGAALQILINSDFNTFPRDHIF